MDNKTQASNASSGGFSMGAGWKWNKVMKTRKTDEDIKMIKMLHDGRGGAPLFTQAISPVIDFDDRSV